ncbi:ADP-ribose pyrophosphatase YjhB (NUDIX family) [Fontibacillus phaseoli]|uniref:ADP-ribose pyrophosphatase YjhB (NUDIX family) n=1 Tax=Fontibacillus phaseoli TaxID=1416533 RepID=A0A369BP78_9BACL|nr:NUDIX domain-containing protein [Fontibacillus phaseoli]RCX21474.1 ADP-ribose pyrophosphatase YjhB (NUDIX family) [Fontibacillus phaseoli]
MKEYIKDMREFVGNRPILMCGASVIIYNPTGQVLMLHRTDNDSWCFPGGAIELGEKVEEAAEREAFEETGLTIENLNLFAVFSGEELYYKYPNGDEVYNVDIVFKSDSYQGEVRLNNEGKEARFFDIDKLPEKISPPVRPVVEELRKRRLE